MNQKDKVVILKYFTEFFLILLLSVSIYLCYYVYINETKNQKLELFDEITNSGILKAAIIDYDITDKYPGPGNEYFIDVADFLASRLWARLELINCKTFKEAEELVLSKKADILIISNPKDKYKKTSLAFSKPYLTVSWHLVVNRDNLAVNNIKDLKKDHKLIVTKNCPGIKNIPKSEKENLNLIETTEFNIENIFSKIESGEITGTIADNLTGRSLKYLHPKVALADQVNENTQIGFALHPLAKDLMFRINIFIDNIKDEEILNLIASHYFHKVDVFEYLDLRKFHRKINSKIPEYYPLIKKYADEYQLDWRLLTAQIYQESHFDEWAKSNAKAKGLMQLMPNTAAALGVRNIYSPEENIRAGAMYLKKLYDIFSSSSGEDRMKIALASYNVGQGHIYDARKLSRKFGVDPEKWYNMVMILPLLKKKEYYSTLTYGYARGDEPVTYVRKIYGFYKILKIIFPAEPDFSIKGSAEKQ
ncbi:MAG: transglycosylase SLT domain-containing protein [Desulforegulaceae bacterium]|nr:transglycosylase SLT domain-containing protein [Desulforegulaceae bacterium]